MGYQLGRPFLLSRPTPRACKWKPRDKKRAGAFESGVAGAVLLPSPAAIWTQLALYHTNGWPVGWLVDAGFFGLRRFFGKRVGAVGAELERIDADVQAKLVKVDAELMQLGKTATGQACVSQSKAVSEVDHSLALKVADEVTRIEQNLAQMDASVKGHKQLTAAVKRMHENLQASGYQLPELLGKAFDEGMKVTRGICSDENPKG
ncbi:MAG: hypothetical protein IPK70_17255 [Flavobacteriales bacterium]|nr:hypothetical protein [Flavobacteriales bacterium]